MSSTAQSTSSSKRNGKTEAIYAEMARERGHAAVDIMSDKAASTEEKLRETAASSSDAIAGKSAQAKQAVTKTRSEVESFAKENPWAAAGIAFAAGAVISTLFRRR